MANEAGGGRSRTDQTANHAYNVSSFVGDPHRAREILGWEARVPIEAGVRQLVADFRAATDEAPAAGCPAGGPLS